MTDPAATYDPALGTDLDVVRYKTGDTDVSVDPASGAGNWLNPDATISAILAMYPDDWRLACADVAEGLASRFAQEPDSFTATGDMSVSWRDRVKQWQWLAQQLRAESAAEVAASAGKRLVSAGVYRPADFCAPEYRSTLPAYLRGRDPHV